MTGRLTNFRAEQTVAHEANKQRSQEHCAIQVAMADQATDTLVKHTNDQLALLDEAEIAIKNAPSAEAPGSVPNISR